MTATAGRVPGSRRAARPRRRSSRARPEAPGAASRPRWAKRARPSCAPAAARRPAARSDYDRAETIEETAELGHRARRHRHRDRGRPPRSRAGREPRRADPPRPRPHRRAGQRHLGRRGAEGRAGRVEHARSGSTTSTRACGSSGSRSTPTSSRRTTCSRCSSTEPGGLLVEVTDGTTEYNASQLPDLGVLRPRQGRGEPARVLAGPRAGAVRSDCGRDHAGVPALGDDARSVRRVRGRTGATRSTAGRRDDRSRRRLRALRVAALRRPRRRRARVGSRPAPAGTSSRSTRASSRAEYGFTDVDGSQPDIWRYIAKMGEPGADVRLDEYR